MFELYIEKRRIIPIRAIPEVTCRDMSPDIIAGILAEKITEYQPHTPLESYHLECNGEHYKMYPREWDVVIAGLERLEIELGIKGQKWTEFHPSWREKSIATVPQATFAWWDEFVIAHTLMFPPEYKIPFDDRPGYQEINEHPYLDPNISTLIYEGFEKLIPHETDELSKPTGSSLLDVDLSARDFEIGAIAQRIRSMKPAGYSERKIAEEVYVVRRPKGPKPERLRQIIRNFQIKIG
jgi:hypothetical protein